MPAQSLGTRWKLRVGLRVGAGIHRKGRLFVVRWFGGLGVWGFGGSGKKFRIYTVYSLDGLAVCRGVCLQPFVRKWATPSRRNPIILPQVAKRPPWWFGGSVDWFRKKRFPSILLEEPGRNPKIERFKIVFSIAWENDDLFRSGSSEGIGVVSSKAVLFSLLRLMSQTNLAFFAFQGGGRSSPL